MLVRPLAEERGGVVLNACCFRTLVIDVVVNAAAWLAAMIMRSRLATNLFILTVRLGMGMSSGVVGVRI